MLHTNDLDPHPTVIYREIPILLLNMQGRLALTDMDSLVQFYFEQGLSSSTHRTYTTGINRFNKFCSAHDIKDPFPLSQTLLCYFALYLANQGLLTRTIKVYLSELVTNG